MLLGLHRLPLEVDLLLSGRDSGLLGLILAALGGGTLGRLFRAGRRLLATRLLVGLQLGVPALVVDPALTLLGGDFALQTFPLEIRLHLLSAKRGLGLAAPRLGGVLAGVELRV